MSWKIILKKPNIKFKVAGTGPLAELCKNVPNIDFVGFKTGKEKTQKEVADELRNITKLYLKIRKENNK